MAKNSNQHIAQESTSNLRTRYAKWKRGRVTGFWSTLADKMLATDDAGYLSFATGIIAENIGNLGSDAPVVVDPLKRVALEFPESLADTAIGLLEQLSVEPPTTRSKSWKVLMQVLKRPDIPEPIRERLTETLGYSPVSTQSQLKQLAAVLRERPLKNQTKNASLIEAESQNAEISAEQVASLFTKGNVAWHRGQKFRCTRVKDLKAKLKIPSGRLTVFSLHDTGFWHSAHFQTPNGSALITVATISSQPLFRLSFGNPVVSWQQQKGGSSHTGFCLVDSAVHRAMTSSDDDGLLDRALEISCFDYEVVDVDSLALKGSSGNLLLIETWGQSRVRFFRGLDKAGKLAGLIFTDAFERNSDDDY